MWPFGKNRSTKPVEPVSSGGMTAHYDAKLKYWSFQFEGIKFRISGSSFDPAAFDWAKEAASVIHSLDDEIRACVLKCLESWPCDKNKAEILSAGLDEYTESKTIGLVFVGDESWGDFGVCVIITDGKIVDAYGGD